MLIRWFLESRRVGASALSIAVLATFSVGSAGAASVVVEPSGGQWKTTYEVTLNQGSSDLENIVLLYEPESRVPSAASWSHIAHGGETTVITTLTAASEFKPGRGLNLGVMTDSEGDHLVLMMDEEAADFAVGKEWSSLFGDANEESLIAALRTAGSSAVESEVNAAVNLISSFGLNEANDASAWFRIDGAFKIVAFSDGELIGSGISRLQFLPAAAVPEPASLALAGLGVLGVLAFERSRRRRAG